MSVLYRSKSAVSGLIICTLRLLQSECLKKSDEQLLIHPIPADDLADILEKLLFWTTNSILTGDSGMSRACTFKS